MANTKDIQRRIKSIASTKKITRAMEMVAAAKMRKAVESTLATRTYANLSWETLINLTRGGATHPLLEKREKINKQAIVVITSNRGLCGGFNSLLMSLVRATVANSNLETDIILIGKKGESLTNYFPVVAQFPYPEAAVEASDVAPIISFISEAYLEKKYDQVLVAYSDFINAVKQVPKIRPFLPIMPSADLDGLGIIGAEDKVGSTEEFIEAKAQKHSHREKYNFEYQFEPKPRAVLDAIVPRLLEIQLYQAFLESSASEHSARMSAMHQATQAANDLGVELTLSYNKARQSAITAEIAEITAGVAALN